MRPCFSIGLTQRHKAHEEMTENDHIVYPFVPLCLRVKTGLIERATPTVKYDKILFEIQV